MRSFIDFLRQTFGPEGIFSSGQEGHAFLIGVSEIVCPWKPRWNMPPDYTANGNPLYEYHYYMFGRGVGVLLWIVIACVIKVVLF